MTPFMNDDYGLYFSLLVDTTRDEIFVFGYGNLGPIPEYVNYKNRNVK
jgi:hypothetical protein